MAGNAARGYGRYYDQLTRGVRRHHLENKRPINGLATLVTSNGASARANFAWDRPLPDRRMAKLPLNVTGQWLSPKHVDPDKPDPPVMRTRSRPTRRSRLITPSASDVTSCAG
jgi:hypothetical protein